MTRFIADGIEVPAIPKVYKWPDGGWRPEEPDEAVDPQPEKTLLEKLSERAHRDTNGGALYAESAHDVFREHFDSKFDDIADWLGKYAQQAITTGVIDNNEAHGDLRAILFGEHA